MSTTSKCTDCGHYEFNHNSSGCKECHCEEYFSEEEED